MSEASLSSEEEMTPPSKKPIETVDINSDDLNYEANQTIAPSYGYSAKLTFQVEEGLDESRK